MDYYDTNFDYDNEDGLEGKDSTPSREQIIFLVDAHQSMFETFGTNQKGENQSYFDLSVRVAADMLKARILSAENDEIALVFFGTCKAKNGSGFDHIFTFQDLDIPDAMRIRELEELTMERFQKGVGIVQGSDLSFGDQLKYALWTSSQMFEQSTHKAEKRIMLFTNQDNPCSDLDPVNFWRPIIEMLKGDDDDDLGDLDCFGDTLLRLDMIFDVVRKRQNKKRPVASIEWYICSNMKIGVQVFSLIRPAVKPPAVYLDAKTNERLMSSTAHICLDTGAVLTHTPLYSFQATNLDSSRYPKVTLTSEERVKMKALCGTGLKLIGFKSLELLKDFHQVTKSYFLYPDEKAIKGSVTAFSAFHSRMHASKKFALCCYATSRGSQPTLVALVAQQEGRDSDGLQVNPPGFQMISLPFLDDLRHPEMILSAACSDAPRASKTQVDLATNLIKALSLSKGFSSTDIANPHLQRHYQVIEAVALQVLVTDLPLFEDETKPDLTGMAKYNGIVQSFKDSIPPSAPSTTKKRKAPGDSNAELLDSWDWQKLMQSGGIARLTVPQLKKYLQSHDLPTNGKKSDLIDRIRSDLVTKRAV